MKMRARTCETKSFGENSFGSAGGQERRRNASVLLLLASAVLLEGAWAVRAGAATAEENWPAWRGPLATGVAPKADPPAAWSETSNVKWKVKIPGRGTASPIIWDNRVFIQTAIPTGKTASAPAPPVPGGAISANAGSPPVRGAGGRGGMTAAKPTEVYQFVVLCLDRQTGNVLWQRTAREEVPHEGYRANEGSFASQSPVTDGKHVFAYFGSRGIYCYDMDGTPVWDEDFGDMRISMAFGEGSSPALYGDTLVINWDHEGESFILALDKNTHKTLWKKPREEKTSWATPLVVVHEGKPQVVTAASGRVRSYDLASGELIWECSGLTGNVIPSPVAGDGMVYCLSGYRGSALLAIRLGGKGDLAGTDFIAWRYTKSTPYVPSPLLYGGKLYFFAVNNSVLSCLDAKSGQVLIDAAKIEALEGVYASPIGAGDKVYLVGRNGTSVVLKLSDEMEVLATNRLEERFDASPAAAGKELFLRGQEYLYCVAEK